MKKFIPAALVRALRTLIQAAASSAIVAIGSATTMGEVNWVVVASTAGLSAILSLLTSLATGLPEAKAGKDEATDGAVVVNLTDPEKDTLHVELSGNLEELAKKDKLVLGVKKE